MTIDFSVTKRALTLGSTPDSVTGWYAKTFTDSTKEVIIVMKGSSTMNLPAGLWVRTDALGLTQDAFVEGDEIYYSTSQTYYEVKAIRNHYLGNNFYFRELDLMELPLHE